MFVTPTLVGAFGAYWLYGALTESPELNWFMIAIDLGMCVWSGFMFHSRYKDLHSPACKRALEGSFVNSIGSFSMAAPFGVLLVSNLLVNIWWVIWIPASQGAGDLAKLADFSGAPWAWHIFVQVFSGVVIISILVWGQETARVLGMTTASAMAYQEHSGEQVPAKLTQSAFGSIVKGTLLITLLRAVLELWMMVMDWRDKAVAIYNSMSFFATIRDTIRSVYAWLDENKFAMLVLQTAVFYFAGFIFLAHVGIKIPFVLEWPFIPLLLLIAYRFFSMERESWGEWAMRQVFRCFRWSLSLIPAYVQFVLVSAFILTSTPDFVRRPYAMVLGWCAVIGLLIATRLYFVFMEELPGHGDDQLKALMEGKWKNTWSYPGVIIPGTEVPEGWTHDGESWGREVEGTGFVGFYIEKVTTFGVWVVKVWPEDVSRWLHDYEVCARY